MSKRLSTYDGHRSGSSTVHHKFHRCVARSHGALIKISAVWTKMVANIQANYNHEKSSRICTWSCTYYCIHCTQLSRSLQCTKDSTRDFELICGTYGGIFWNWVTLRLSCTSGPYANILSHPLVVLSLGNILHINQQCTTLRNWRLFICVVMTLLHWFWHMGKFLITLNMWIMWIFLVCFLATELGCQKSWRSSMIGNPR